MLTNKVIPAIAVAGIGAAVVLAIPGFSPEADASTPPKVVKGDRLDIRPIGKDCTQQAWPYYETGCLRDRNQAMGQARGQARAVRIISTDRPTDR